MDWCIIGGMKGKDEVKKIKWRFKMETTNVYQVRSRNFKLQLDMIDFVELSNDGLLYEVHLKGLDTVYQVPSGRIIQIIDGYFVIH